MHFKSCHCCFSNIFQPTYSEIGMDTMSIMSPDSKGLGKPMHSRLSVVMQMSPMIMPHSRHSRMQSPADLSLPSVDTPGASFGQEAHHVCTILYLHSNTCSYTILFMPHWVVWWMTSKNPPKTTYFCEGVQTSPYSGFICGRAYLKDTSLIFHFIPFPTFTTKMGMFAGGRKEKFVNGPHPPD